MVLPAHHAERFVFAYDARVDPDRNELRPAKFDLLAVGAGRVLSCDRHLWAPAEPGADKMGVPLRSLATVRDATPPSVDAWIVALELRSALHQRQSGGEFWPTDPSAVGTSWTFLGTDVVDYGLLSVINFYGLGKRDHLRSRFQDGLSVNGLFFDDARATEFIAIAEALLPDDAPFYAVGLWRVP